MRNTVLFSIIILLLFSCKKNKYTTAPQLKYKSVNKKVFQNGDIIVFTLSFTDAEGDLAADSSLYIKKVEPKCATSNFSQYYRLPDFPAGKDQSGEILITYGYNNAGVPQQVLGPQCPNRNDTCVFKFIIRDKAKNKSDTVTSDAIVLIR